MYENLTKFYMITARKVFSRFFGGGMPPCPIFWSYACERYWQLRVLCRAKIAENMNFLPPPIFELRHTQWHRPKSSTPWPWFWHFTDASWRSRPCSVQSVFIICDLCLYLKVFTQYNHLLPSSFKVQFSLPLKTPLCQRYYYSVFSSVWQMWQVYLQLSAFSLFHSYAASQMTKRNNSLLIVVVCTIILTSGIIYEWIEWYN